MALINCPECGKEISDKAKNCIHCGYPLDSIDSEKEPDVTENAAENPDKTIHINTCTENISQTTTTENQGSNPKDFFTKYKAPIIACLVGVIAIVLLIVFLIKPQPSQPSFEENLVGIWTSSKDSSSGKASITFSYENDVLSGDLAYYDYDNSEWDKMSFTVDEYTEYTMTLLFEGGKIDKFSYSIGKDKLIFDGVIYTNADKNVKIDETKRTYILDGVPMPVIEDVYLGMTESEFKGTEFYTENKSSYSLEYLDLPNWFYPTVDGFVSFYFNKETENLQSLTFFFRKDTVDKTQKLKTNIIEAYSSQFGDYEKKDWSTADYTDYIWKSGNLIVTFCDQTREDGNVAYTVTYTLS